MLSIEQWSVREQFTRERPILKIDPVCGNKIRCSMGLPITVNLRHHRMK